MKNVVALAAVAVLLGGCGPSQQEYDELQAHAKALEAELHELKFGAQTLLEKARTAFAKQQDQEALDLIQSLLEKHPNAAEAAPAQALLGEVKARIEAKSYAEAQALKQALGNMRETVDEIRQITWVRHVQEPESGDHISMYFGMKNNNAATFSPRLVLMYSGNSWINTYKIIIRADEQLFELDGIRTLDEPYGFNALQSADVELKDKALLEALMTANRVLVRFQGPEYYGDFELSKPHQANIAEVYRAYKRMGGQF